MDKDEERVAHYLAEHGLEAESLLKGGKIGTKRPLISVFNARNQIVFSSTVRSNPSGRTTGWTGSLLKRIQVNWSAVRAKIQF